jgi:hypothetical protein
MQGIGVFADVAVAASVAATAVGAEGEAETVALVLLGPQDGPRFLRLHQQALEERGRF